MSEYTQDISSANFYWLGFNFTQKMVVVQANYRNCRMIGNVYRTIYAYVFHLHHIYKLLLYSIYIEIA